MTNNSSEVDCEVIDDVMAALDERHAVHANGSEPEAFCNCPELIVRGKRVPMPPGHDCDYVRARTALIGEAEKIADSFVEPVKSSEDDGASNAAW